MVILIALSAAIYVWQSSPGAFFKPPMFFNSHHELHAVTNSPPAPNSPSVAIASGTSSAPGAMASASAHIETIEPAPVRAASAAVGSSRDPFAELASATSASPASAPASSAIVTPVALPLQKSANQSTRTSIHAKPSKPHADEAKRQATVAHAAKPREREATRANKATSGRDPDVDLLAALMAHASGRGGVNPTASARDVSKSIDEPSIAKLVKRCESLNGEDALQCQRRMCDGYWGRAQACPAKSSAQRE